VSASEKLAALDAAMTAGPWSPPESEYDCIVASSPTHPGKLTVIAYGPEDERFLADAEGIVTQRNALPELVAFVAAVEGAAKLSLDEVDWEIYRFEMDRQLHAALASLTERLG
jgi:hypothetical protein